MKVKDLIAQLETYDGDTDLIVAYWDKETIEGYVSGWGEQDRFVMTDAQWSDVVFTYEDGEWHFQGSAASDFAEIAKAVVEDAVESE
jgi:hypothetical protein